MSVLFLFLLPAHRLIVVAEKQVVYKNFPIPLINRLEKHFLTLNNILTEEQLELTAELKKWAKLFAERGNHILQNNRYIIFVWFHFNLFESNYVHKTLHMIEVTAC